MIIHSGAIQFIESFNDILRGEYPNVHCPLSLSGTREKIERWRVDDNAFRPHISLSNLTQSEFRLARLDVGNL